MADPTAKLPAKAAAELEEAGPYAIDPTSHANALAEIEDALRKASDKGPACKQSNFARGTPHHPDGEFDVFTGT
jgi:hypothetical protein